MKRRTFVKSLLTTGGAALLGGTAYAYQSSIIDISEERVVFPRLTQGLRVVAVSDLHMPSFYLCNEELIRLVNSKSPDIFILAGDIIDKRGNESLVGVFGGVKARVIKLAALGNWEYRGGVNLSRLRREYEKAGISLLVNREIEISAVTIIVLDDFVEGSPNYQVLKRLSTGLSPVVVVSHCPEVFDFIGTISTNPVIMISGHTHGGQIAPFGLVLYTPPGSGSYVQGWYHQTKHSMYVMRGIGTNGIPLRIGARPEILVLDVVATKD